VAHVTWKPFCAGSGICCLSWPIFRRGSPSSAGIDDLGRQAGVRRQAGRGRGGVRHELVFGGLCGIMSALRGARARRNRILDRPPRPRGYRPQTRLTLRAPGAFARKIVEVCTGRRCCRRRSPAGSTSQASSTSPPLSEHRVPRLFRAWSSGASPASMGPPESYTSAMSRSPPVGHQRRHVVGPRPVRRPSMGQVVVVHPGPCSGAPRSHEQGRRGW